MLGRLLGKIEEVDWFVEKMGDGLMDGWFSVEKCADGALYTQKVMVMIDDDDGQARQGKSCCLLGGIDEMKCCCINNDMYQVS